MLPAKCRENDRCRNADKGDYKCSYAAVRSTPPAHSNRYDAEMVGIEPIRNYWPETPGQAILVALHSQWDACESFVDTTYSVPVILERGELSATLQQMYRLQASGQHRGTKGWHKLLELFDQAETETPPDDHSRRIRDKLIQCISQAKTGA